MRMVKIKCAHCGAPKEVREADRRRGWGLYCDKSCKAKAQEKRTGQYAAYRRRQNRGPYEPGYFGGEMHPGMSEDDVQGVG